MSNNKRINEIKEQIDNLVESLDEYGKEFYYEYSQYFTTHYYHCLEDMIAKWSDNQIDLYYSSLLDWIREYGVSVDYIQRAFAEGLVDGAKQDVYQIIQCAQYLFYFDEVYADFTTLEQLKQLHEELHNLELELDDQVA